MKLLVIILTLISTCCYSQDSYQKLLSVRLNEIEKLSEFENSFVVLDESNAYGSTYPFWEREAHYYQDDIVSEKGLIKYRAIRESIGKNPGTSPNDWGLIIVTHPYFFLRDTAKAEDLKKLLTHKHPYVRTYAFGALWYRNADGLFNVILENLSDTTRILQMTSDYGYEVCPADLMISYKLDQLTEEQKSQLKKLIETKYKHLEEARKLLGNE